MDWKFLAHFILDALAFVAFVVACLGLALITYAVTSTPF